MKRRLPKNSYGFTLVELLIVIVIIGLLAAVLVSVINPTRQKNTAQDAGVKAAMNKVALAAEGFVSAYGAAPDGLEFISALQNVTANSGCTADNFDCTFSITGNTLPDTCSTAWGGSGADQCYFRYYVADSSGAPTVFQIYAKSFGVVNTVFMYDNSVGELQHCDVNGSNCVTP